MYIRNEIGYRGMDILEPFIAYDFGRIPKIIRLKKIDMRVYKG